MTIKTSAIEPSNLPFSVMLGREDEMRLLRGAFDEVVQTRQPQIVTILGDSGWGKTRLLTEFYAELAQKHGQGYWPSSVYNDANTMRLNPLAQDFQWVELSTASPGFYWWGIRFSKPDQRNSNAQGSQLQVAAQSLLPHLLFAEHAKLISAKRKSALDLGIDALLELGPTAIGETLFPGAGLIKPIFLKYQEKLQQKQEIEKIQKAMSDASSAEKVQNQNTTDKLLLGLDALIHRSTLAISDKEVERQTIPFVICLDDAHWLDTHTASFISTLLTKSQEEQWPLLLLITAWPSEWHQFKSNTLEAQHKLFFQSLDQYSTANTISLKPCSKVDQLIEHELPGLPLQQRQVIAKKAGPDLYGLHGLLANLKNRPKRFIQGDIQGQLTDNAVKEFEKEGPVREDVARERLLLLPAHQQEILGILSLLGPCFIHTLGKELLEQLQLDGWTRLSGINIAHELDQIKDLHHYLQQISQYAFAFVDEVKQVVAKDSILDDPAEVATIKVALLSVANNWLEMAMFDDLSDIEIPIFFDNIEWALNSENEFNSTHSSLQSMTQWRLEVLQDIFIGPYIYRKRTPPKSSSTYALDISSFRAGLPLWWQAQWLLHQSQTTHQAALQTFEGLIKAAKDILFESVAELVVKPSWKVAEAAGNSATGLVSLTWSCINQAPINNYEVNDDGLLQSALEVLETCFNKSNTHNDIAKCVSIVLLIEISEINRGLDKNNQLAAFTQASHDLEQLIESDKWENSHAEFLFKRVFVDVLFADFYNPDVLATITPVANALVVTSQSRSIRELGSFQLVSLGMAYRSLYWINHSADKSNILNSSTDCCIELIERGLGDIVASHCWLGDVKVNNDAQISHSIDHDELPLTERKVLAWNSVSTILGRVFEQEAHIQATALFEICKKTLTSYAALFFEPWQVRPGDVTAFIKQVNTISPNSGDMLLTSACYGWYIAAIRQAGDRSDPNDMNWVIHYLEAIKAIRLIPPQMVSITKDYEREMKLEMPFFKLIEDVKLSPPIAHWIGSMVVSAIDCKDFYKPSSFSYVVWHLLSLIVMHTSNESKVGLNEINELQIKENAVSLLNSFRPDTSAISHQLMDDLMAFKQLILVDPRAMPGSK
jgi:hypothetical protein